MRSSVYSVLCCAFLVIHFSGKTQENEIDPVFSIRANPFSFLETDAGVQIGVGYQWNKRWGVTLDPTYIFYTPVRNWNSNERGQRRGIKIRSDLRYYFTNLSFGRGFSFINPFIAPEFHYKYVSSEKWTDFGINCVGQQCDYYMNSTYKETKKEIGVALKAGLTRPLGTRWALEAYGGVGIKFRHMKEKELPLGGSFVVIPVHDEVFGVPDGKPTTYMPIGLKLVYSFINKSPGNQF